MCTQVPETIEKCWNHDMNILVFPKQRTCQTQEVPMDSSSVTILNKARPDIIMFWHWFLRFYQFKAAMSNLRVPEAPHTSPKQTSYYIYAHHALRVRLRSRVFPPLSLGRIQEAPGSIMVLARIRMGAVEIFMGLFVSKWLSGNRQIKQNQRLKSLWQLWTESCAIDSDSIFGRVQTIHLYWTLLI